jgi:hypothetical protein
MRRLDRLQKHQTIFHLDDSNSDPLAPAVISHCATFFLMEHIATLAENN